MSDDADDDAARPHVVVVGSYGVGLTLATDRVPDAGETISYQMPTVTMDGKYLVYFAAWKQHIGMYPIPVAGEALENRIAPYRGAKDAVKFLYKKPIPYDLIEQIADLLVSRRLERDLRPD